MKKKWMSLCLALVMCLSLIVPTLAIEQEDQRIVVNGETYTALLKALLSEEEDKPVTARLETDIQLTNDAAVVLGSSDYDGMFGGQVITVASHDITIDLNGHTLTSNSGYPVFIVERGYTLTILDSSAAKTGKLVSDTGTPVDAGEGAVYNPLPAPTGDTGGSSDDDSGYETVRFTDVKDSDYFAQPVQWAVRKGVTAGTSDTTFSPYQTCTNAQILTFMWRAAGSPEPAIDNPFANLTGSEYYYKPALWAAGNGMLSGDTFEAEKPCARAMTMEYLWKLAGSPETAVTGRFADVPTDAAYAQAVAWALNKGVTAGTGGDAFSPDAICTRGQIVTFLKKALDQ